MSRFIKVVTHRGLVPFINWNGNLDGVWRWGESKQGDVGRGRKMEKVTKIANIDRRGSKKTFLCVYINTSVWEVGSHLLLFVMQQIVKKGKHNGLFQRPKLFTKVCYIWM